MAGHNKWSKIKRQKAGTDAAKAKIFGKLSRAITIAAKLGSGLDQAIAKAREFNMPNDNIDRAVKKATEAGSSQLESITYEAYGPGGCALIIEALTANRNKAAQEIKFILSEHGTQLASQGSASWAFAQEKDPSTGLGVNWKPTMGVPLSPEDEQKLGALIDALEENDEVQEVFTNAD